MQDFLDYWPISYMSQQSGFPVSVWSDQTVLPSLCDQQARIGEQILALGRDREFVDLDVHRVLHLINWVD